MRIIEIIPPSPMIRSRPPVNKIDMRLDVSAIFYSFLYSFEQIGEIGLSSGSALYTVHNCVCQIIFQPLSSFYRTFWSVLPTLKIGTQGFQDLTRFRFKDKIYYVTVFRIKNSYLFFFLPQTNIMFIYNMILFIYSPITNLYKYFSA